MALVQVLPIAGLLSALFAVLWLILPGNHRWASVSYGIVALVLAAIVAISWGQDLQWQSPQWLSIGPVPVLLRADSLSAFFIAILSAVSICCAMYSARYLQHKGSELSSRLYWSSLFVFIGGMAGVLLAGNAVVFLVAWELMSLSSAALVVSEYRRHNAQRASFIYIVATRIATLFIVAAFLLMQHHFNDWSFSSWHFNEPSTWVAAGLLLAGLAIKAGVWPFHIWLPYAHSEAPSPISALMSGVMVKVAVYAIIRFFVFDQLTCRPLAYALLVLAAISAFWGVLFAINQRDLKRLLAYSTVENVGLILLSVSVCLLARTFGLNEVARIALIAALFQSFSHALFKALLFLCAGSIDYAAHSREFAALGGLMRRMPVTGLVFVIGSAAICALPPLNGFASKWCLYQSLLYASFQMPGLFERAVCMVAFGLLATVGALAVACFAKAIGVGLLGRPRSRSAESAQEVPFTMLAPQVALALGCVLTGLGAPWLQQYLTVITATIDGAAVKGNLFALVPLWQLALVSVVTISLIYVLFLRAKPASFRTWDCGFGGMTAKSQVTADSFAQPIARIFTTVLQHRVTVDITGQDRRHFPEKISVEPSMVSLLETRVYGPLLQALNQVSRMLSALQAGSIHLYLMYVCIALVVLLVAGTQL